jgi:hypothetical protein
MAAIRPSFDTYGVTDEERSPAVTWRELSVSKVINPGGS